MGQWLCKHHFPLVHLAIWLTIIRATKNDLFCSILGDFKLLVDRHYKIEQCLKAIDTALLPDDIVVAWPNEQAKQAFIQSVDRLRAEIEFMRRPDTMTRQEIYAQVLDFYPIGTPHPLRATLPPEATESSPAIIEDEELYSNHVGRMEESELTAITTLDSSDGSDDDDEDDEDDDNNVMNDVSNNNDRERPPPIYPLPTGRHAISNEPLAETTLVQSSSATYS